MSAMIERLEKIEQRYQEISELMMSPEVLSDNRQLAKLGKEQSSIAQVVETYSHLKSVLQGIEDATELEKENDPEVKEMAKMELEELLPQKQELLDKLEILLIPKDPADQNNAIMEIRGAAGGDEGNIFAGDLYRMYVKYAESKGWKTEIIEMSESEAGGFTRVAFMVKGPEVYGHLKFESGSHRVQRVPKTETQGRVHTSTATVLVDPEIEEDEIDIDPNDLEIDTMRASGAGGQHVNKTDSAVRVTHIPTGISVKCQDGRSQHENRATALMTIRAKVYTEMKRKEEEERNAERKSKLGTGDRSEKIRTYNYPQNRVTDHRIGLTLQQLDRIMEGKLDDVINALLEQDQKDKLAGNA
ncbi:peptide chain release factor 1 [Breznakia sp. PF5-3]|uniref:peptide chain release factor 1 n=1 Tax=unclassified Breznakia TaxID=2623764 RepID=UPI00240683D7|nr:MULTISPECIES: peptide chain release factor 1 [unclassified Breznakia]MDF9824932.1 peptide chain release factor 1 [Breznakia sp. PM6-1]MDF9835800.1 peptide chain release factor 1 [Breznakia sp. PF5-3]MDF9837906.1 peptide chain release factor 1 [Breznakia sp. PFB2-8]MDF9859895.1 peptide chain release factor 1 [Breznakia sp. PH5-24]